MSWCVIKNEDESGLNPYIGGFSDISNQLISRKRNVVREKAMSSTFFDATLRPQTRQEEKCRVKSLNSMQTMEKAFILNKSSMIKINDSNNSLMLAKVN